MARDYVLALDQGTTSSRAIVFDRHGSIVTMAQREYPQGYPSPGHVIHDRRVFRVEKPESKNRLNSYASPSPTVEDGRVYVHYGT